MAWSEAATGPPVPDKQPYELLDDGFAPEPCDLLVIGCGNILRGDDAVGPVLVRTLLEGGLADGVRVVDGGTAGMDVAFAMRGAARVVIVDAAATGAEPGTVYRVPAEELADLPPVDGLHTHNLRWDHALSFGAWLLGPHRPTDVTVYLVEGDTYEPGAPLSPRVDAGMRQVAGLIRRDHLPAAAPDVPETVELTEAGYLHLPAAVAARHFPSDVLLARLVEGPPRRLELVPVHSAAHGGLVLKQRTADGDRSVLIHEVLHFAPTAGTFEVTWDDDRGALIVHLDGPDARPEGDDHGEPRRAGGHRDGGARAGTVGGLPGADHGRGSGAPPAGDAPLGAAGPAGGGHGTPDRGTAPSPSGGDR